MKPFTFQHGKIPADRTPEQWKKINEVSRKRIATQYFRAEGAPPVASLDQLMTLSMEKRSVYHRGWRRAMPATVVASMQARQVHAMLLGGWLLVYPKP